VLFRSHIMNTMKIHLQLQVQLKSQLYKLIRVLMKNKHTVH
jgi:hypothetical protein